MNITITINTDNDAFSTSMNGETARILDTLTHQLRRDEIDIHVGECYFMQDYNGNTVGKLEVSQ